MFVSLIKKEREEFSRDDKILRIRKSVCEGIKEWEITYKNWLAEIYGKTREKDREAIGELCRWKLLFQFENGESENTEYLNLSLPLLGRHDFVHLLEGPNLVEMSSMLNNINSKFEEGGLVREILNISGAPMDFRVNGNWFVRKGKTCWFTGNEPQKRIKIHKNFIYAIVCVEFKKGIKEGDKFVELSYFLIKLQNVCPNTRKCILGMFLGFGLHDLIIVLEGKRVSDIILSVTDLRRAYSSEKDHGIVRDTSTIFSIPEEESEYSEEDCVVEYSTLVSIVTGADFEAVKEIKGLGDKRKDDWILNDAEIFERQGYYDLIVSFKAKSHYHAGLFTTALYNIDPILRTSTMVKMNEDDVESKFRSWNNKGVTVNAETL